MPNLDEKFASRSVRDGLITECVSLQKSTRAPNNTKLSIILLQQSRSIQGVDSPKPPIPDRSIVKIIGIFVLHELYRLLQFIEILFQNLSIV